jgi:hypothetical protein
MTPPHKNDVIIRRVAVARHAVFNCPKRLVEQADRQSGSVRWAHALFKFLSEFLPRRGTTTRQL